MAVDLLGPASALNAVTVRPSETRVFPASDTFFKPCSSPTALDGTAVQAVFLNGLLVQLRRAIRGMGITESNSDDDMLLKAIQAASSGLLAFADAAANMPVHALVGTAGLVATSTSTGSIVVSTGQSVIHRGIKSYDLGSLILANRTFATSASKTYHLRWHAPGTGDASPASSWPVGRLLLKDLSDSGYNPSALAESNTAFDSTYDNVLLARVATNGSNALTVTTLLNMPVLTADLTSTYTQSSPGQFTVGSDFSILCVHAFSIGWGRTPKFFSSYGWVYISTVASGTPYVNGSANQIATSSANRYAWNGSVTTDWLEPPLTLGNYGSTMYMRMFA